MKLSWGYRIAGLYAGFMLLILSLVVGSMRQRFDLVSKDYYEEELRYQEIIDAGKNQQALSAPVRMDQSAEAVSLRFPPEFEGVPLTGEVMFYSPVQEAWDLRVPVHVVDNSMSVSKHSLPASLYIVKIRWEAQGQAYYQEERMNINR